MSRSRESAKTEGTRFESQVAAYLADALASPAIERRAKRGSLDAGDIAGVFLPDHIGGTALPDIEAGGAVVIECKNEREIELWQALRECEREARWAGAALGAAAIKLPGVGYRDMGHQLVALPLTGRPPVITRALARAASGRSPFTRAQARAYADGGVHIVKNRMGEEYAVCMSLGAFAAALKGELPGEGAADGAR